MQVGENENKPPAPPKKKPAPGPGLNVEQFVGLMRRLDSQKDSLSNEQVRFIQAALHRYENEPKGTVKTKLATPKPKKKSQPVGATASVMPTQVDAKADEFVERLIKMETEGDVLKALENLSDLDAERLARDQGFRASGPQVAREKLAETIMHLRQIERIAGAGTKRTSDQTKPELQDGDNNSN